MKKGFIHTMVTAAKIIVFAMGLSIAKTSPVDGNWKYAAGALVGGVALSDGLLGTKIISGTAGFIGKTVGVTVGKTTRETVKGTAEGLSGKNFDDDDDDNKTPSENTEDPVERKKKQVEINKICTLLESYKKTYDNTKTSIEKTEKGIKSLKKTHKEDIENAQDDDEIDNLKAEYRKNLASENRSLRRQKTKLKALIPKIKKATQKEENLLTNSDHDLEPCNENVRPDIEE